MKVVEETDMAETQYAVLHTCRWTQPKEDLQEVLADAVERWSLSPRETEELGSEGMVNRLNGEIVTLEHSWPER